LSSRHVARYDEADKGNESIKQMSSNSIQQEALVETAEQTKRLVEALIQLSKQMEIQHKDNSKSQNIMLAATVIMAIATVLMAIPAFIALFI
jgi:UDP-glucose 6-dehydrogenase